MQRAIGLQGDRGHAWIVFSQTPGNSSEGAGRAQASQKMSDAALRLPPNLFARSLVMGAPIRVIIVLIQIDVSVGKLSGQVARQRLGAVGAFHRIRFNDFNAVTTQDQFSLAAGVARQAERDVVTARRRDHSVGNSGVAAAGVENCFARS